MYVPRDIRPKAEKTRPERNTEIRTNNELYAFNVRRFNFSNVYKYRLIERVSNNKSRAKDNRLGRLLPEFGFVGIAFKSTARRSVPRTRRRRITWVGFYYYYYYSNPIRRAFRLF